MKPCSKCGIPHQRYRDRAKTKLASYCFACHAAWMRDNRPPYADLPIDQKNKSRSRSIAGVYFRRGKLPERHCHNCGGVADEKHHDDYKQPLAVKWFCRPCHVSFHHETKIQNVSRETI